MENFTINDEFLCLLEKSKADEKSMNRCLRDFYKRMIGRTIIILNETDKHFTIIKVEKATVPSHLLKGICYDIDFGTDYDFAIWKGGKTWFYYGEKTVVREATEDEWQYIENLYNQLTGFKQGLLETLNIKTK